MKVRIPVSERIISKVIAENEDLKGIVEEQTFVFYKQDGTVAYEMHQRFHEASPYGLVSYYIYADEYKQKELEA